MLRDADPVDARGGAEADHLHGKGVARPARGEQFGFPATPQSREDLSVDAYTHTAEKYRERPQHQPKASSTHLLTLRLHIGFEDMIPSLHRHGGLLQGSAAALLLRLCSLISPVYDVLAETVVS